MTLNRIQITFVSDEPTDAGYLFEDLLPWKLAGIVPEGTLIDQCEFDFPSQEWVIKRSQNL